MDKLILDMTCSYRSFWFNKKHPRAWFTDWRCETLTLCDKRKIKIEPDQRVDFRELPFEDGTFSLVVFDPPHLNKLGKSSWLAQKYGRLLPSWEDDLRRGVEEGLRVLKVGGTLIFKWSEEQIKLPTLLEAIKVEPLFGHKTSKNTHWLTFMKFEEREND